jgi:hypothetical protein
LEPQFIKALERSEPGTDVKYLDPAVDEDKDPISYSIVGGDTLNTFSIDETFALIEVKASTDALVIVDTNNPPVTVLTIRATDSTGLYDEADVTIDIVDSNFKPVFEEQYAKNVYMVINENSPVGTVVCFQSAADASNCDSALSDICSDADEEQTLSYSVSDSPSSTITFDSLFALDAVTGQITVASDTLNFEDISRYVFRATVVDDHPDAPMEADSTLVIRVGDVNEAPLVWDNTYLLPEYPLVPSSITRPFEAGDVDQADTGNLQYLIVNISPDEFADSITIDESSGEIYIADNQRMLFDFETEGFDGLITLLIKVSDVNSLSSDLTLTLSLQNVNEEPTVSDLSVEVPESILPGEIVGTLVGSDPDSGTQLHYRLVGDDSHLFNVNSLGEITLDDGKALDFEVKPQITLTVEMEDELLLQEPYSMLPIVRGAIQSKFLVKSNLTIDIGNVDDVAIHSLGPYAVFQTGGNESVVIKGANFGTLYCLDSWSECTPGVSPADLQVTYSNGRYTYTPECILPNYPDSNTEIHCVTEAGQGVGYVWSVSIGGSPYTAPGVAESPFETSYGVPSITSVVSPPSPTAGGALVQIEGTNFGLEGSQLVVLYGSLDISEQYWYNARNCTVVTSHSSIECLTTVGVGESLHWLVKVESQSSTRSADTTQYLAPELNSTVIFDSSGAEKELLKTSGNELVHLYGGNFGPRGSYVEATYGPSDDIERYPTTRCEVTTDHVEIVCDSVPGVGAGLSWKVAVSGQWSEVAALGSGYEPPSVERVFGPGSVKANTDGGQVVYIDGDNFGPTCVPSGGACVLANGNEVVLRAFYGTAEPYDFEATSCSVTQAHSQISCVTAEGTGLDHAWKISVEEQWSPNFYANTSYARPVVSLFEGTGARDSPTAGTQEVYIYGRQFGSSALQRIDSVTYGPTGFEYVAENCTIATDHTAIMCHNVPGAGKDHHWIVTIDGQVSERSTTNYGKPEIHSFSGAGSFHASTDGGELIRIHGRNFGPAGTEYLEGVQYGYGTYSASDCVVVGNHHDTIECTTSAGVGENLRWSVTIEGQESEWSLASTSYAPPKIEYVYPGPDLSAAIARHSPCHHRLALSVDSLATPVGSTLSIKHNGQYARLLTQQDKIRLTPGNLTQDDLYELELAPDITIPVDVRYRVDSTVAGPESMVLFALDGHRTASVPLSYLMSAGLATMPLRLADEDFSVEDSSAESDLVDPPLCVFDCNMFDLLTEGTVDDCAVSSDWVGTSCMDDCSSEDLEQFDSIREALCDTPFSNYGGSYTEVGDALIEFSVTLLPATSTCDMFSVGGAVRVLGSNFGVADGNAQQFVSFDGDLYATTIIVRDTDDSEEASPLHELEVSLPAGFGLNHKLSVLTCNKKPSAEFQVASEALCTDYPVASEVELIDYTDPHIRSLYTYEKINEDGTPDQDNVNVKILGSNFGLTGLVYIMPKDMSSPWQEAEFILHDSGSPKFKETEIEVVSPFTSGYVKVLIGERESRPSSFDDKSPEIVDVSVMGDGSSTLLDSNGGNIIEVVGKYFGVEPQLAIGGTFCEIFYNEYVVGSYTDRVIQCLSPPGQGFELKVEVMVGKKVSCSNFKLSYKGPQLMQFDSDDVPPPYGSLVPTIGGTYLFAGQNFGTGMVAANTDIDLELAFNLGAGSKIGSCNVCDSKTMCDVTVKPPAAMEFLLVSSSLSLPVEYINSTHLSATIPPGVGRDLQFEVNVGGQNCLYPEYELCSVKLTLNYDSPTVAEIEPRMLETDGSTVVTFTGDHFGCCNDDCDTVCDMVELRRRLTDEPEVGNTIHALPHAPRVMMDGAECELLEFSNTRIVCIAPEGQGTDVVVMVTVGEQDYVESDIAVSYQAPTLESYSPDHGPTAGNVSVVVHGQNFGRGGVVHFVMSSDDPVSGEKRYHDGSDNVLVSDSEQYNEYIYGPDELASYIIQGPDAIVSWNHTMIIFNLPEGQGLGKSFQVRVGKLGTLDNCDDYEECWLERTKSVQTITSTAIGAFNYDPPQIYSIDTGFEEVVKGPTRGGFVLRILGENFGSRLGLVFIGADPLDDIVNGKQCYNATQTHNEVTCLFPPGIGLDLDVIFVQRYPTESSGYTKPQLISTLEAGYSYFPPVIDVILPASANAIAADIKITGREFGAQASAVEILIGSGHADNVTCSNAALAFKEWGDELIAELRCSTGLALVGSRELQVTVAGQVAEWNGMYGFEFSCYRDFYGRDAEYCVECPRSPETGAFVADCEGPINPIAHLGWFYNPKDADSGLCHEYRMAPYSNRTECPYVMKCDGFRDDCLGRGGGSAVAEFPYSKEYLDPPANVTCDVMPDKSQCRTCVRKANEGKTLLPWEVDLCSECYWKCHNVTGSERFNVQSYGNRCSKSTIGELCNDCVEGYYKMNNVCEVCPDNTMLLVGLCLLAGAFGGALMWYLRRFHVNYAICNIFVDYAQVVAVFVGADVPWPDELRRAFVYLSALNFNVIELLGVECTVEITYASKFFMYMTGPIILGLGCAGLFVVLRILSICTKKGKDGTKTATNLSNNILGMFLIGFNIMYLILCRTTMDVFNCTEMVPSDGFTYMVSTHDKCWEYNADGSPGEHMKLVPFAIASLVFYALGFPLFLGWLISRNAAMIDEDMKLRAKQQHHQRKKSEFYGTALRLGRFYKYFRPDCKQWNMVIAARKFFLAATALLFRDNATFQLSIALLGMFTAFVYQVVKRPYWSIEERDAYVKDLYKKEQEAVPAAVNAFIHNLKVHHRSKQVQEHRATLALGTKGKRPLKGKQALKKGTAKVGNQDSEMAKMQHEEQNKVMEGAKSVIFNLNTIEAYTLASTVMVNLSGIMLLSGQFENLAEESEYQRDLITYTILVIIFSSFVYLGISFLREIRFARSIGMDFTRAKWRAAIRKQIAINKRKKQAGRRFQDSVYMMMRKHNIGTYGKKTCLRHLHFSLLIWLIADASSLIPSLGIIRFASLSSLLLPPSLAGSMAMANKEELDNRITTKKHAKEAAESSGPNRSFLMGFANLGIGKKRSHHTVEPSDDRTQSFEMIDASDDMLQDTIDESGPGANAWDMDDGNALSPATLIETIDENETVEASDLY